MTRRDGRPVRPPTAPTGRRRTSDAQQRASGPVASTRRATRSRDRATTMVDGVEAQVARGRHHLIVPVILSLITLAAVLLFLVAPAQTWLEQRRQLDEAERELAEVQAVNDGYQQRIDDLQSDAEIARIAREQYNLVGPGQEAYVVLPPPTTTAVPAVTTTTP